MNKKIGIAILILLLTSGLVFAESIFDWPVESAPSLTDRVLGVENPGGTPVRALFSIESIYNLIDTEAEFEANLFTILTPSDVDDTPVNGSTTVPVSSNALYDHENDASAHSGVFFQVSNLETTPTNGATTKAPNSDWAYDHENGSDPHTGYLLESAILDEDDMTSDSATVPPSQQSVKAYVDAIVPPIECVIESFTNSMDGKGIFHAPYAITLTHVGVACEGTCTTVPTTLTFHDGAGNDITAGSITVAKDSVSNGTVTFASITAGGSLLAGEKVEIDTVDGMSPETDTYFFIFKYTVDH